MLQFKAGNTKRNINAFSIQVFKETYSFFFIVLCKDDFLRKTMVQYSYLNIKLKNILHVRESVRITVTMCSNRTL